MSVKLLTEHHLEFLSLKGGCRLSLRLIRVTTCQNVKLLEISCRGSYGTRVSMTRICYNHILHTSSQTADKLTDCRQTHRLQTNSQTADKLTDCRQTHRLQTNSQTADKLTDCRPTNCSVRKRRIADILVPLFII